MAKATNLKLFIGTDFTFNFTVLNAAETEAQDVSAWAVSWMLKSDPNISDASASVTKTSGSGISVSGTWNATPASSTQRLVVVLEDTDTSSLTPGTYYWELKRTDAGSETVLGYGLLSLVRGVHQ